MIDRTALSLLIVTLIVSTIVWAGFSFYKAQNDIEVNGKAVVRSRQIRGEFDIATLDAVSARVEEQNYDIEDLKIVSANNPKFNTEIDADFVDTEVVEE